MNQGSEPAPPADRDEVLGERGPLLIRNVRSLRARVSAILSAALVLSVGTAALAWYYTGVLHRQASAREAAATRSAARAQGEMVLPSLGHIAPPPARVPAADIPAVRAESATAEEPTAAAIPMAPGLASGSSPLDSSLLPYPAGGPSRTDALPVPTQRHGALERRLGGKVFATAGDARGEPAVSSAGASDSASDSPSLRADPSGLRGTTEMSREGLEAALTPSATAAARAQVLPTQRLLLPKGAFIDCTLETAIDSSLPGMTTCITATDTFSADGQVVLLERGTKLVGETRGQVQQGSARLFVLWTEARTPSGVVVPLDSPGTDELGRAGLAGHVQRHFWDRFGAAILISLIDGAVQYGAQSAAHGGNTVIFGPSSSQGVLTEVLKGTINIPPTVSKHNGDRIQILVARDLDFRPVYELRAVAERP